jgi:hypothetical protein
MTKLRNRSNNDSTHSVGGNKNINFPPAYSIKRVSGCKTERYCAFCEVRTEFIYVMYKKVDRLCGLVVRVPGRKTEMYCSFCEVRTEFIYVMYKKLDRLCGLVGRVPGCKT